MNNDLREELKRRSERQRAVFGQQYFEAPRNLDAEALAEIDRQNAEIARLTAEVARKDAELRLLVEWYDDTHMSDNREQYADWILRKKNAWEAARAALAPKEPEPVATDIASVNRAVTDLLRKGVRDDT